MQPFHVRHQDQAGTEGGFRLQALETEEVQFTGAAPNYSVQIGGLLPIGDFKPEHFVKRERLLQGNAGKTGNRNGVRHSSSTQSVKFTDVGSLMPCPPAEQRISKRRGRFEADHMARAKNSYDLRVRDLFAEDVGVNRRDESILFAPDNQRRRFDPPQSSLQSVLGNREEELRHRAEAARHREQYLDLLLRAVVFIVEEHGQHHHPLRRKARLVVKEIRDKFARQHSENINDRRLVAPQSDRRNQSQSPDLFRPQRGHFGGHPSAEGFTNDVWPFQV